MAVERLEITNREPYEGGHSFGSGGSYERIDAIVHYVIDPAHPANQPIADIELASRIDGAVRFTGDLTLLIPEGGGNRSMLFEAPNRGNRVLNRMLNQGPVDLMPSAAIVPGDAFLMRHGWTLAWCGWQWDVPKPGPRMGIEPPLVPNEALTPNAPMNLRVQPNAPTPSFPLTDHHVGSIGNHRLIATRDVNDPEARLLVRDHMYGDAKEIAREKWQFAQDKSGEPVTDAEHVWLEGGFEAGKVYDLIYTPAKCPVAGAGLIALRDLGTFLKHSPDSPLAGTIDHSIAEGISQCGRLLRTFLHLGMNTDEEDRQVFDGLLVHIAGGRRGEFNHRYGQPSVQPTPTFGHLFPFADDTQADPHSGSQAGLLDRQSKSGNMPKIFYTDTSSEYWRGDASLQHTSAADGSDIELPGYVRRYLFAGTQHVSGLLPFADVSAFGSRGSNYFNIVDYRPLYRAAVMNLLAWVRDGTEPPASCYPMASQQSAATREAVAEKLDAIPGLTTPDSAVLPSIYPLDLGEHADKLIGMFPAKRVGPAYPCRVSDVDSDGNETGGVRMPDIMVPVATHTGFNVRHPKSGGDGQILEYVGLTHPFAKTEAERESKGDPRPSLEARYPTREDYIAKVTAAAQDLARERYIMDEDIELCVAIAAERYDGVMSS
ncbi:MAG: alpha/beta hydrolase domain-containing protein [Pseudomonadota bacterium]